MKTIFFTISIISLFLLSGCNSSKSENKDSSNSKEQSANQFSKTDTKKTGFKNEPMNKQSIKELTGFKDKIEEFLCWSDPEGKHIVFTNETGTFYTNLRENGELYDQNAEVSCYHYIQKPGKDNFEKSWKIFDYSRDCPVDAFAKFKNNTLQKTDLNKNGTAEIWTMYYTYCKGDVSPSKLKIIMYEGQKKYKMTGETKVQIGENEYFGGRILSEGNFTEQPGFLKFAKSLWKNNCKE